MATISLKMGKMYDNKVLIKSKYISKTNKYIFGLVVITNILEQGGINIRIKLAISTIYQPVKCI